MQCKSYSHFFSKKFQNICVSLDVNFNESLTNDVVSFEQLGPARYRADLLNKLKNVCSKAIGEKMKVHKHIFIFFIFIFTARYRADLLNKLKNVCSKAIGEKMKVHKHIFIFFIFIFTARYRADLLNKLVKVCSKAIGEKIKVPEMKRVFRSVNFFFFFYFGGSLFSLLGIISAVGAK